jgi:SAM-dependent MidA family methyltransferase
MRLEWSDRPADPAFAAEVRAALARAGQMPDALPAGYTSEYAAQACGWVASIAQRLDRGVALLFDYGFPAAEYYHPQRSGGTLMCHFRHRAHTDPFHLPGLQDLTSHVDFDAIAQAALQGGAELLGYTSQANFLLNCGLLDHLTRRREPGDPIGDARHTHGVQQLVSEAEMGELFKVIAFGRGVADDAIGFDRGDRRHRLAAGLSDESTAAHSARPPAAGASS